MKWFKKMIECVNRNGIMIDPRDHDWARMIMKASMKYAPRDGMVLDVDMMTKNAFFNIIDQNEVFVFEPSDEQQLSFDSETKEVAAPFKVTSVEMSNGTPITSSSINDQDKNDGYDVRVYCVVNWVIDWEEGDSKSAQFVYAIISKHGHEDSELVMFSRPDKPGLHGAVQLLFERLNYQDDGYEKVREMIKTGTGRGKSVYKIRRIIHIRSKKSVRDSINKKEPIDWNPSHRFIRRGHWRKLDNGIGKNRSGEYCVHGKTWVNESRPIGPDDMPLIKKVRYVRK